MNRHIITLLCMAVTVSGCNTMAGVGRDMAYSGNSITKWSQDVREEVPNVGYVDPKEEAKAAEENAAAEEASAKAAAEIQAPVYYGTSSATARQPYQRYQYYSN